MDPIKDVLRILREVRSELVKDEKYELSLLLNSAILLLKTEGK